MASRPWRLILFICARYLWALKFNKLSSKRGFADLYTLFVLPLILFSWEFFVSFIYISCCNFFFSIYYLYSMQSGPLMSLFPNCRLLLSYFKLLSSIVFFLQARLENNVSEEMQKLYLRWLDIVFILCARARLLDFWGIVILVKHMLFSHAQFLILRNLDFVNLTAIFFSLFLQFPSVNFYKIWQHGEARFQLHDERFKFANQKLQYFLPKKTTYFNIAEKLARSTPFFSPNEIVTIKFTCTQNIETLHPPNLKNILNMFKKTLKTRDFKLSTILESGTKTFNKLVRWIV